MRFSIITFSLLLFVTSTVAAQSAPSPEITSEDDLKLGIWDVPAFQPAAQNFIVRQAEDQAKGGELLFVLGNDTPTPRSYRRSPSFYRLYMACRERTEGGDELAIFFELLESQQVPQRAVVKAQY
jgi:hypothetical protein